MAGSTFCRVQLDQALATADWSESFPMAMVRHLTAAAFDHGPILLGCGHEPKGHRRMKGRFLYELMWESHEEFSPMLAQDWQGEGQTMMPPEFRRKLGAVSGWLEGWV